METWMPVTEEYHLFLTVDNEEALASMLELPLGSKKHGVICIGFKGSLRNSILDLGVS